MTDYTSTTLRALVPRDPGTTHWEGCSGLGHEWCEVARHADAMEKLERALAHAIRDRIILLSDADYRGEIELAPFFPDVPRAILEAAFTDRVQK